MQGWEWASCGVNTSRIVCGVDPRIVCGVDPRIVCGVDPRIVCGVDPRIVCGVDPRIVWGPPYVKCLHQQRGAPGCADMCGGGSLWG
jgi:hypothetical protein